MSISSGNIGLIDLAFRTLGKSWKDIRVGELGNQKILIPDAQGREYKKCTGKEYFKKLGSKHTSFDLNGLDGAVVVDLANKVPFEYHNLFDILTNYGTTEHIEHQFTVFMNIHNMMKIGGVAIHSVPLDGYWVGHSPYHYTKAFVQDLIRNNNYDLIHCETQKRRNQKLLNFVYRKSCSDFQTLDSWVQPSFSLNYKHNEDNLF